jgi:hypothetical protein
MRPFIIVLLALLMLAVYIRHYSRRPRPQRDIVGQRVLTITKRRSSTYVVLEDHTPIRIESYAGLRSLEPNRVKGQRIERVSRLFSFDTNPDIRLANGIELRTKGRPNLKETSRPRC